MSSLTNPEKFIDEFYRLRKLKGNDGQPMFKRDEDIFNFLNDAYERIHTIPRYKNFGTFKVLKCMYDKRKR